MAQVFVHLRSGDVAGTEFLAQRFAVLLAQAMDGHADCIGGDSQFRLQRFVFAGLRFAGEIRREEGEMFVSGIRFPRKVLNKTVDGKVTVISFDKVTVGERFPAEAFAVPPL